jgi:hypothetical protein
MDIIPTSPQQHHSQLLTRLRTAGVCSAKLQGCYVEASLRLCSTTSQGADRNNGVHVPEVLALQTTTQLQALLGRPLDARRMQMHITPPAVKPCETARSAHLLKKLNRQRGRSVQFNPAEKRWSKDELKQQVHGTVASARPSSSCLKSDDMYTTLNTEGLTADEVALLGPASHCTPPPQMHRMVAPHLVRRRSLLVGNATAESWQTCLHAPPHPLTKTSDPQWLQHCHVP